MLHEDVRWKKVMDLAEQYGLITSAVGGAAVLVHPEVQREEGIYESTQEVNGREPEPVTNGDAYCQDTSLGRSYWGPHPLPGGAKDIGTAEVNGQRGLLLHLADGTYALGTCNALTPLTQEEVRELISKEV